MSFDERDPENDTSEHTASGSLLDGLVDELAEQFSDRRAPDLDLDRYLAR
jgi:hypothetical protein